MIDFINKVANVIGYLFMIVGILFVFSFLFDILVLSISIAYKQVSHFQLWMKMMSNGDDKTKNKETP